MDRQALAFPHRPPGSYTYYIGHKELFLRRLFNVMNIAGFLVFLGFQVLLELHQCQKPTFILSSEPCTFPCASIKDAEGCRRANAMLIDTLWISAETDVLKQSTVDIPVSYPPCMDDGREGDWNASVAFGHAPSQCRTKDDEDALNTAPRGCSVAKKNFKNDPLTRHAFFFKSPFPQPRHDGHPPAHSRTTDWSRSVRPGRTPGRRSTRRSPVPFEVEESLMQRGQVKPNEPGGEFTGWSYVCKCGQQHSETEASKEHFDREEAPSRRLLKQQMKRLDENHDSYMKTIYDRDTRFQTRIFSTPKAKLPARDYSSEGTGSDHDFGVITGTESDGGASAFFNSSESNLSANVSLQKNRKIRKAALSMATVELQPNGSVRTERTDDVSDDADLVTAQGKAGEQANRKWFGRWSDRTKRLDDPPKTPSRPTSISDLPQRPVSYVFDVDNDVDHDQGRREGKQRVTQGAPEPKAVNVHVWDGEQSFWCTSFIVGSFLSEVTAGVSVLFLHLAIWFFCEERFLHTKCRRYTSAHACKWNHRSWQRAQKLTAQLQEQIRAEEESGSGTQDEESST